MTNIVTNLAKLKLEVIKYHTNQNGESTTSVVNQKFLEKIAQDACYVSYKSLDYKDKMIDTSTTEYDGHVKDGNIIAAERTESYIDLLSLELDELQIRHDADCQVYTWITGGQAYIPYKPQAKKALKKESSALKAARERRESRKQEVGA